MELMVKLPLLAVVAVVCVAVSLHEAQIMWDEGERALSFGWLMIVAVIGIVFAELLSILDLV